MAARLVHRRPRGCCIDGGAVGASTAARLVHRRRRGWCIDGVAAGRRHLAPGLRRHLLSGCGAAYPA
jgi:hypothetical protein